MKSKFIKVIEKIEDEKVLPWLVKNLCPGMVQLQESEKCGLGEIAECECEDPECYKCWEHALKGVE